MIGTKATLASTSVGNISDDMVGGARRELCELPPQSQHTPIAGLWEWSIIFEIGRVEAPGAFVS
jgi:hypothetical protein